ncbi:hypothetical protein PSPO01_14600 [Paraphaeosphaeria sporulosa]
MLGPQVTILVVPYCALIEDHVQRISQSGITCVEWTSARTYPTPILVVSAGVAGDLSFLQMLLSCATYI